MLRTSSHLPCQGATRSWRAWSSREHGGHVCRGPWSPGGHRVWDKVEQRTPSISLGSTRSGTSKPILRLHIVPPSCLECRELLLRWRSQDIYYQPSQIGQNHFLPRSLTKWSSLWTSCPHWWRPQDSLRWTNVPSIPGTCPGAGRKSTLYILYLLRVHHSQVTPTQ